MAQTQRQVKAITRDEAMAKAVALVQDALPGVQAVAAAKGTTTKAQREAITRYPDLQPWMVTLEYDLAAAVSRAMAPRSCGGRGARSEMEAKYLLDK